MGEISFSDGIGIAGIILAFVLLALDKAGKLKGEWLLGLLLVAGLMTLFIAIGNSWVLEGPPRWKLWKAALMFSFVGLVYSAAAIWITGATPETEGHRTSAPVSTGPAAGDHQELSQVEGAEQGQKADDTKSPIDRLSELGWTVRPETADIQFEIAGKSIPVMEKSASYFRKLRKPFRLHFQSVKGIGGLHLLAGMPGCTKIEINAGEFADISELRGFDQLTSLIISQTPINGLSTIDLSPISSLRNLRELNLYSTKITELSSISMLSKLRILNLKDTPIRDLSPLRGLVSLDSLDVTGTGAISLSPLREMGSLRELGVSGKQTADLTELVGLRSLKVLRIIDQGPVDLSSVGNLANLESLFIWGPPTMNLSPLAKLTNLRELQISGFGVSGLSAVTGLESLGDLKQLRRLTLGSLQASDLTFVGKLGHLTEINIGMMPVSSVAPLRGLASLKSVSLNLTSVVDISPLLDLPALTSLSVVRTPARVDVLTELEKNGVKIQR